MYTAMIFVDNLALNKPRMVSMRREMQLMGEWMTSLKLYLSLRENGG